MSEKLPPPKRLSDLGELAPKHADLLAKLDELLAEGATFEDVMLTASNDLGIGVPQLAVENYFHRNIELQARRVRRMVEKAEHLRAAIGDPESAEGKLAQATLFTGLMGLTQKATAIDLEDVHILRLRREKLDLECKIQQMREKESSERRGRPGGKTLQANVVCLWKLKIGNSKFDWIFQFPFSSFKFRRSL